MANDLQTTQARSLTHGYEPQLNSKLNALVESDTRLGDLPAISVSDRDEIGREIMALEAASGPTDQAEISRMLGKLAIIFPNGKLSAAEAKAQNLVYAEMLADIPADILGQAFRKIAQTSRFFPTIAEIREAAAHGLNLRSWRLMRLKWLAANHDRKQTADDEPLTDEQRAQLPSLIKSAA